MLSRMGQKATSSIKNIVAQIKSPGKRATAKRSVHCASSLRLQNNGKTQFREYVGCALQNKGKTQFRDHVGCALSKNFSSITISVVASYVLLAVRCSCCLDPSILQSN